MIFGTDLEGLRLENICSEYVAQGAREWNMASNYWMRTYLQQFPQYCVVRCGSGGVVILGVILAHCV